MKMMELGIRHLQLNKKETGNSINEKVESTNYLVSQVAYLLGVRKSVFENDYSNLQLATFKQMDEKSEARIVRNLCIVRTCLIRRFRHIANAIRYELKNLDTLPELIPQEAVIQLEQDGVDLLRANHAAEKYIIDINVMILERINACQTQFPIWLQWDYVRPLFIMPEGTTAYGTKTAFEKYHKNLMRYPYQVYINWDFIGDEGNLLFNDEKFVRLLYRKNNNSFTQMGKITDATAETKMDIYDFINGSESVVMICDCENIDPYKVDAVLHNLDQTHLSKIKKIILIDDELHTPEAWKLLDEFTSLCVERVVTSRVMDRKSLVDITLSIKVAKEHYQDNVDSFLLFSSDSDYWVLIRDMQNARFFVAAEKEKSSPSFTEMLHNAHIPHCYIDDFCTGNCDGLKKKTLSTRLQQKLDTLFQINISSLLSDIIHESRMEMSETERKQFIGRYVKPMRVSITGDGELHFLLGE